MWVGDLPKAIEKVDIGKLCPGLIYVSVNNTKTKSVHACATITFEDLALALEALERLQWTKFDHGAGQMNWPSVKCLAVASIVECWAIYSGTHWVCHVLIGCAMWHTFSVRLALRTRHDCIVHNMLNCTVELPCWR